MKCDPILNSENMALMHRLISYLFLGFLALSAATYGQESEEAQALVEELVTEKGNIGVAAGYAVGTDSSWVHAAGYACEKEGRPFTDTTLTRIASISKNLTAVAVMQLVEKGRIDLDAPIQRYYPEFPKKAKGEITTRQLLAHTSGISPYMNEQEIENTTEYPRLEDAVGVFRNRPLSFEPGSRYLYTSYGYVLLGRIIEKVSGLDFEAYMKANILDPAGMTQTSVERAGLSYSDKSCLYFKKKKKAKEVGANNLSNRIPGGGYQSTLQDLMKFGQALLDGRLIRQQTLESMLVSQPVEYEGNRYGLGWYFYGPAGYENLVIGHSGGQTGCTSQLMLIPKSQTVVVVLSNTARTYPDVATLASNLIRISEQK